MSCPPQLPSLSPLVPANTSQSSSKTRPRQVCSSTASSGVLRPSLLPAPGRLRKMLKKYKRSGASSPKHCDAHDSSQQWIVAGSEIKLLTNHSKRMAHFYRRASIRLHGKQESGKQAASSAVDDLKIYNHACVKLTMTTKPKSQYALLSPAICGCTLGILLWLFVLILPFHFLIYIASYTKSYRRNNENNKI